MPIWRDSVRVRRSAPCRTSSTSTIATVRKRCRFFGQDLFLKAQAKGPLTDKAYVEALAKNHQLARTEGIDALMDKHRLDAIVAPTGGPAWLTDLVNGDHVGRRQFKCSGGRGLSEQQCDCRISFRLAGGDFILWPCLERAHTNQDGVLVRAGYQGAAGAEVSSDHRTIENFC